MKKIVFISGMILINLILSLFIVLTFNPNRLPLTELQYFNGFDITLLFPSDLLGNIVIIGSIIGMVFANTFLVKTLKK